MAFLLLHDEPFPSAGSCQVAPVTETTSPTAGFTSFSYIVLFNYLLNCLSCSISCSTICSTICSTACPFTCLFIRSTVIEGLRQGTPDRIVIQPLAASRRPVLCCESSQQQASRTIHALNRTILHHHLPSPGSIRGSRSLTGL